MCLEVLVQTWLCARLSKQSPGPRHSRKCHCNILRNHRQAKGYWVWPLWLHIIINTTIHLLRVVLWLLPFMAVLYFGVDQIMRSALEDTSDDSQKYLAVYLTTTLLLCGLAVPFYLLLVFVMLSFDIGGKWLVIGRRRPGRYNWDERYVSDWAGAVSRVLGRPAP